MGNEKERRHVAINTVCGNACTLQVGSTDIQYMHTPTYSIVRTVAIHERAGIRYSRHIMPQIIVMYSLRGTNILSTACDWSIYCHLSDETQIDINFTMKNK